MKLHVFPGSFDLDVVSKVCGDGPTGSALPSSGAVEALRKALDFLSRRGLVEPFTASALPSDDPSAGAAAAGADGKEVKGQAPGKKAAPATQVARALARYSSSRFRLHPVVREFAHLGTVIASLAHSST